jgi:hypothetical protein
LALDKRDPKIAPKLHNELKKLHTQDLKSRMKTIFPPKSELAIFAAGPSKIGLVGCLRDFKNRSA